PRAPGRRRARCAAGTAWPRRRSGASSAATRSATSGSADGACAPKTVEAGERFPAKFGRTGFRRNFPFHGAWRGRRYSTKQVDAFAVGGEDGWLVINVV